jgi:hypothetical protein
MPGYFHKGSARSHPRSLSLPTCGPSGQPSSPLVAADLRTYKMHGVYTQIHFLADATFEQYSSQTRLHGARYLMPRRHPRVQSVIQHVLRLLSAVLSDGVLCTRLRRRPSHSQDVSTSYEIRCNHQARSLFHCSSALLALLQQLS